MPSWTPRPPISFQAGLAAPGEAVQQATPAVRLQVVDHPDEHGPALVSPATAEQLGIRGTKCFVGLAEGSDCILSLAVADDTSSVADGQLAATAAQQHNLHLGAGIHDEFRWGLGLQLGNCMAEGRGLCKRSQGSLRFCPHPAHAAVHHPPACRPLLPAITAGCLCRRRASPSSWWMWGRK